jgi:hypothetical protein
MRFPFRTLTVTTILFHCCAQHAQNFAIGGPSQFQNLERGSNIQPARSSQRESLEGA